MLGPRSRGATQIHHPEPRAFPAQGKRALPYLSSSPRKDEQRTAPEWPRLPLTRESRATNEHAILPQPPSLSPFTTGKATRAHLAVFFRPSFPARERKWDVCASGRSAPTQRCRRSCAMQKIFSLFTRDPIQLGGVYKKIGFFHRPNF